MRLTGIFIMEEIWKDIKGYEGLYQVSNYGNVKRLMRKIKVKDLYVRTFQEKMCKKYIGDVGYYSVNLCVNYITEVKRIHQLVAEAFLNHKKQRHTLVIDHIDNNPLNNHLSNLQIITHRDNIAKGYSIRKTSSNIRGVYWHISQKKWTASFFENGKHKHLGSFIKIEDAIIARNKYEKIFTEMQVLQK